MTDRQRALTEHLATEVLGMRWTRYEPVPGSHMARLIDPDEYPHLDTVDGPESGDLISEKGHPKVLTSIADAFEALEKWKYTDKDNRHWFLLSEDKTGKYEALCTSRENAWPRKNQTAEEAICEALGAATGFKWEERDETS